MKPSDPILKKTEEPKSSSYTPPGKALPPVEEKESKGETPTPPSGETGEESPLGASLEESKKNALGSGLSIASLILGLFGVICCSCCGLPTGIAGIVLAVIDRVRRGRFDGIALAGLITSIVSIFLFLFSFTVFFFLGIMDGLLDDGMVIPPAEVLSLWRFL